MLIPKFGSSFTAGRGPDTPVILKGPSARLIRVGIGPPRPCEIEYRCHPLSMVAEIRAVPLPPAGTLEGETDIETETGFCPNVHPANENIAMATRTNFSNVDLKMVSWVRSATLVGKTGRALRPSSSRPISMIYGWCISLNHIRGISLAASVMAFSATVVQTTIGDLRPPTVRLALNSNRLLVSSIAATQTHPTPV